MTLSQSSVQKIRTYIGFAFKAGKCVLGVDNIVKIKKPMLILYSTSLSQNSIKKAQESATQNNQEFIGIQNFNEITPREGCKALAIKDKNLASAILEQLNNENTTK